MLNKIDERIKSIDELSLREKFKNIIAFHKVSAKTGAGIADLIESIKSNITKLPHIGDKLPEIWLDIRKELEKLNKDYINYEEYENICQKHKQDKQKAKSLSEYYHDLGVFLNFQDNHILKEVVFLNPEWATNAVYKVLDTKEIQSNNGKFDIEQLKNIWKDYPETQHKNFLELMKKFELCFQIQDKNTYIIPELLSPHKPNFDWDYENNLIFEYNYEFMPAGILSRFTVRKNHLLKDDIYWKYGLIMEWENTKALVISEPLNRKIKINIKGNDKKTFLGIIREDIEYIHKTFNNLVVKEMIPCNCGECKNNNNPTFFEYNELKQYQNENEKYIKCSKIKLKNVDVNDLLTGIDNNTGLSSISKIKEFLIDKFSDESDFDDLCRELGIKSSIYTGNFKIKITNLIQDMESNDPDYIQKLKNTIKKLKPKFDI